MARAARGFERLAVLLPLHAGIADVYLSLLSLCVGKYKILTKDPAGKEVAPTDKITYNAAFSDRARRIKVPMIAAKITQVG